ncbi:MAG: YibE/F family protein [Planctomycetales bacterium]
MRISIVSAMTAITVTLAIALAIGAIALWPGKLRELDSQGILNRGAIYPATAVSVEYGPCSNVDPASGAECRTTGLELRGGPDEGSIVPIEVPDVGTSLEVADGDRVLLAYQPDAPSGLQYSLVDRDRRPTLLLLAGLFALVVILLGRLRGVAALVGLVGTVVILLTFVLPSILDGGSPVWVAVVGAGIVAYLVLYLAHGLSVRTTVALLGTLSGLALTAVLAEVFVGLAHLSGLGSEEAGIVTALGIDLDLSGLVLAGMIIGAMGAIDDVAVTQASAVWELSSTDPTMRRRDLARAGMRVGRDHVGSIVNTLVLAYAGASLPLLIVFTLSEQSLGIAANGEVLATEIIRTLVGSMGLVAAVPITTWLAARVVDTVSYSAVAAPPARD